MIAGDTGAAETSENHQYQMVVSSNNSTPLDLKKVRQNTTYPWRPAPSRRPCTTSVDCFGREEGGKRGGEALLSRPSPLPSRRVMKKDKGGLGSCLKGTVGSTFRVPEIGALWTGF